MLFDRKYKCTLCTIFSCFFWMWLFFWKKLLIVFRSVTLKHFLRICYFSCFLSATYLWQKSNYMQMTWSTFFSHFVSFERNSNTLQWWCTLFAYEAFSLVSKYKSWNSSVHESWLITIKISWWFYSKFFHKRQRISNLWHFFQQIFNNTFFDRTKKFCLFIFEWKLRV